MLMLWGKYRPYSVSRSIHLDANAFIDDKTIKVNILNVFEYEIILSKKDFAIQRECINP